MDTVMHDAFQEWLERYMGASWRDLNQPGVNALKAAFQAGYALAKDDGI